MFQPQVQLLIRSSSKKSIPKPFGSFVRVLAAGGWLVIPIPTVTKTNARTNLCEFSPHQSQQFKNINKNTFSADSQCCTAGANAGNPSVACCFIPPHRQECCARTPA